MQGGVVYYTQLLSNLIGLGGTVQKLVFAGTLQVIIFSVILFLLVIYFSFFFMSLHSSDQLYATATCLVLMNLVLYL
jgi:hypothetical protein